MTVTDEAGRSGRRLVQRGERSSAVGMVSGRSPVKKRVDTGERGREGGSEGGGEGERKGGRE